MDWQPIDTAPQDGTWIQVRIPNHGSDNEKDCGGWTFMTEQEPPSCWTDGICWDVNEDGVPSAQPTEWKHLPEAERKRPGYVNHQDGD